MTRSHPALQPRVITMEDDPVVQLTVAAYLRDAGYHVLEAPTGEAGLELFAEHGADAVLLDWKLPGITGAEVLSTLAEVSPTTPVIVISGTNKVEEVADALQRGAWDFLIKPVRQMEFLENSIERCRERARLLREQGLRREYLEEQVMLRTQELEQANLLLRRQMQERMEFEQALANSEERFRQLVENVREVFFVRELRTGAFLYVSPSFAEVWGHSCASLYAMPDNFIMTVHEDDRMQITEAWDLLVKGGRSFDEEYRIIRPDNECRWVHCSAFPVDDAQGQTYRIVGLAEDVTARKEQDDKLRSSLREKEILLKEVHHRVKNNLQLVSSLLNLQASYIRSPEDKELFLESQNRIQSMTLVHEELYRSDDIARVSFREYLPKLTYKLAAAFAIGKDIAVSTDVDDLCLPVDAAIPCGLIINELFSNALKHAFSGRESGAVSLTVKEHGGQVRIVITDNGVGFPLDYDPATARSLGMQLVHSLVDQLGAFLDITVQQGTTFNITFPLAGK